jgi:beta-phosphoglucomutase family hydrolase
MIKQSIQQNDPLKKLLHGVIWDMDGVLIDSMEIHFEIWKEVFSEFGVQFKRKLFNRHFGTTNMETVRTVLGDRLSHQEALALAEKRQDLFEQAAIHQAQLIPGVMHWLEFFQQNKISQAVASSNAQQFIESIAVRLEISPFFDAIVSAENLASKPDPAVFLETARRIRAMPSHCLVIEDAMAGVEGARRAGMKCIAIATTNPPSALSDADLVISSFSALSIGQLSTVMQR